MGTRHLICVVKDNKFRLAQYGQWDGYWSVTGKEIKKFLKKVDLDLFKKRVDKLRYYTEEELKAITKGTWDINEYPQLSRDTGYEILSLIENGLYKVQDAIDFSTDGLFCEWAYIIDLDNEVLEVHKSGFENRYEIKRGQYVRHKSWNEYKPYRMLSFNSIRKAPVRRKKSIKKEVTV